MVVRVVVVIVLLLLVLVTHQQPGAPRWRVTLEVAAAIGVLIVMVAYMAHQG